MKAYDFFCGVGGLTRGLLDAGIEVVAGFDVDENCRVTYEQNNPPTCFVRSDIRETALADLGFDGALPNDNSMLFAACAPCQPFSKHRNGAARGREGTLLGAFARLVEAALPDHVLMENVPGMAKVGGFSTFRRFQCTLNANGYQFRFGVLNAKDYGVPQNRRRLVLVASRRGKPSLPVPTHGPDRVPFMTVRDAIGGYPEIASGQSHADIPNHVAASVYPINLQRLKRTPPDGGDRRSWPKHLQLACHPSDHPGHTDVYGRMAWDKPAPALTGRCNSVSNGRYAHPEQDRAISLREAAALQSFPDEYRFHGPPTQIARQIGNAVPVRFAEQIGRHILAYADEALSVSLPHGGTG